LHAVAAVRNIVAGEHVGPAQRLGTGALIGVAVGLVILLLVVGIPIVAFLTGGGLDLLFG
jgi:hypothetical protein